MVVRLRLARWGRKDLPFYRIVAADARAPRDGKHLEIVRRLLRRCSDELVQVSKILFYVNLFFLCCFYYGPAWHVQPTCGERWGQGAACKQPARALLDVRGRPAFRPRGASPGACKRAAHASYSSVHEEKYPQEGT